MKCRVGDPNTLAEARSVQCSASDDSGGPSAGPTDCGSDDGGIPLVPASRGWISFRFVFARHPGQTSTTYGFVLRRQGAAPKRRNYSL